VSCDLGTVCRQVSSGADRVPASDERGPRSIRCWLLYCRPEDHSQSRSKRVVHPPRAKRSTSSPTPFPSRRRKHTLPLSNVSLRRPRFTSDWRPGRRPGRRSPRVPGEAGSARCMGPAPGQSVPRGGVDSTNPPGYGIEQAFDPLQNACDQSRNEEAPWPTSSPFPTVTPVSPRR
jgi:hypothetical protein